MTNRVPIKDFFDGNHALTYEHIKDYCAANISEYQLRELTDETYWKVEAYFPVFVQNKSLKIVFDDDVASPYRFYNHQEVEKIIERLDEKFNSINKIINYVEHKSI